MPEFIAIDTETTGLNWRRGDRAFMVLASDDDGKKYEWSFDVDPFTRKVRYDKHTVENILSVLTKHREWVFHHAAFDIQMLALMHKYFKPANIFKLHTINDTQIIGHHYESLQKRGLKDQALLQIDFPDDDETELQKISVAARALAAKRGWCIASETNTPHIEEQFPKADYWIPGQLARELGYREDHPWHHACSRYGGNDVTRTAGLRIYYEEALPDTQWEVYERHRDVIPVLMDMQDIGVHVLLHEIGPLKAEFETQRERLLNVLRILCELPTFNPRSPKQLQKILFEKYKFEPTKYTDTGPSTDKDVLKELSELDPDDVFDDEGIDFVNTLIQYRTCGTRINYLKNYERHAIKSRLHTSFKQVGTGSVRISSSDPNIQNVGKKDNPFSKSDSFKLRKVFGPEPDHIWYCGDYDQFQLRIFATAANDKYLLDVFERGGDCHHAVACRMFKTDSPTDDQRRAAKFVNFGIIFGAGPRRIETLAKMPGAYELFSNQFPSVFRFLAQSEEQARRNGFVYTLGGYRLQVPRRRPYAAANYIVQGTEGEIVKMAMVRIRNEFLAKRSRLKMFLPVHDELVFGAPLSYNAMPHLRLAQSIMISESERLGIPASVDFKSTTTTWADVAKTDKLIEHGLAHAG